MHMLLRSEVNCSCILHRDEHCDLSCPDIGASSTLQIMFYVIGGLGIVTNLPIIMAILTSQTWRNVKTNQFIVNQCILGMLAAVFLCAGTNVDNHNYITHNWRGQLECRLWITRALMWCFPVASTYNIVAMVCYQFVMLQFPLLHRVYERPWHVPALLAVPWAIGGIDGLSNVFAAKIVNHRCCLSAMPKGISYSILTIELIIPTITLLVLNIRMLMIIRRNEVHPQFQHLTSRSTSFLQARRRVTIMMSYLSVVFFVCWALNDIYILLYYLGFCMDLKDTTYNITICLVYCCSSGYSFVYIILYRRWVKQVVVTVVRSLCHCSVATLAE